MVKVTRSKTVRSQTETIVTEFKHKGMTYKASLEMTFTVSLPNYMSIPSAVAHIDHGKLADRFFDLAGVTPDGKLWEEVRDALRHEIPAYKEMMM